MRVAYCSSLWFLLCLWTLACLLCVLPLYQSLLSGSQQQGRGGGMGLVHSALHVPMGQLGESMGEAFPLSSEQAFCWSLEAFRRDCMPLMPSRNLISHSPDLLPPPSHGAFTLMFCMLQERNECLWQHSTQLGKPTIHCPFPSWEKSQAIKFSPKLCHLVGG